MRAVRRDLEQKRTALGQAIRSGVGADRYGICQDCGEPIAQARLRVLPFATQCVACQAQFEVIRRAA